MERSSLIHTPLLRRFQWSAEDRNRKQGRALGEEYRYCDQEALIADVRGNIERILNTRIPFLWDYLYTKSLSAEGSGSGKQESLLDGSLWNFGMSDYCLVAKQEGENEREFKRAIKTTIDRFEPRINVTELTFGNQERPSSLEIQLKIKGKLWIPQLESRLELDTAIHIGSQQVKVTRHRSVSETT